TTPSWFPHYAGFSAGVLAVAVGAAVAVVRGPVPARARQVLVGTVAGLVLAGFAAQLSRAEYGERFPVRALTAAVGPLPGCITADDPSVLIAMNVLTRNLRRGCPLVLDLGGYTYDYRPPLPRERDPRWQQMFVDHMGSGTATIKVRYHTGFGLARATAREYRRWPTLLEVEGYELKQPR
ncbi:MAG: hypothetical protein ACLGIF_03995, partial [Actinomycetes bacterium]